MKQTSINFAKGLLFAAFAFVQGTALAATEPCSDQYLVRFSAKPKGSPFWMSANEHFRTGLPANLRGKEGSTAVELSIRRLNESQLVAEFHLITDKEVAFSAFSLNIGSNDRPLNSVSVDEIGNAWAISLTSTCPAKL